MNWVIGLLVTIVSYCRGEICLHPELESESAKIESTRVDGRRWVITAKCKRCGERWTFGAHTKHAF